MKTKKIFNGLCTFAIIGILIASMSICAFAKTSTYGAFSLTYSCKATSTKGEAKTSGAVKPYLNCALLTAYDKNGKSKGNASAYKANGYQAVAVKKDLGIRKVKSYHSVTDKNKRQLEPFTKQLKAEATR